MKPKSKDTPKAAGESRKAAVRGKVTPAKALRIPDLPIGPSISGGAAQVVGGKPGDTPTESIGFNFGHPHNDYNNK